MTAVCSAVGSTDCASTSGTVRRLALQLPESIHSPDRAETYRGRTEHVAGAAPILPRPANSDLPLCFQELVSDQRGQRQIATDPSEERQRDVGRKIRTSVERTA